MAGKLTEAQGIVRRRGGWFVTGVEWSGPWENREAAELAMDGEYRLAHEANRRRTALAEDASRTNGGGDGL